MLLAWVCDCTHLLHSQWTSESSSNTSLGMSIQWRWYQMWQESPLQTFHHLFLACDRNSGAPLSLAFSGHSLGPSVGKRDLAILGTSSQMWSAVIKPDSARVHTTAYVKGIGNGQNPAVRTIGLFLNVHHHNF